MPIKEVLWDHNYPGILVRTEGKTQAYDGFFDIVSDALRTIASKPIGEGLLKTISANNLMYNRKVVIAPLSEKAPHQRGSRSSITYGFNPSSTVRNKVTRFLRKLSRHGKKEKLQSSCSDGEVVEDTFYCNGEGCSSTVCWNHEDEETPDGKRPPWVGLAHELIHAFNNLHGLHEENPEADGLGKKLSEAMTVGLGRFAENPFTENKIRGEHGIGARTKYTGVIDGDEVEIFG